MSTVDELMALADDYASSTGDVNLRLKRELLLGDLTEALEAAPAQPVGWVITLPDGELELDGMFFTDKDEGQDYIYRKCVEGCYLSVLYASPALRPLSDQEIESLAIEHEAFGFGQLDSYGLTTHGFNPDGLRDFARAVLRQAQTKEQP